MVLGISAVSLICNNSGTFNITYDIATVIKKEFCCVPNASLFQSINVYRGYVCLPSK